LQKEKSSLFLFSSFRIKVMCCFILAMVFIGTTSIFLINKYALDAQFEQLRAQLMAVASASSVCVDTDALRTIPLSKGGEQTPQYQDIYAKLQRIKKSIPTIKYIYILTKTEKPGILRFMADAQDQFDLDDGPTTYPGDEYDARRFPQMLQGFNAPSADKTLAADEWGVFLSGYAPVRDASGRVMAILGVDMRAEDVYFVQKQVKLRALAALILGILLAVVLGILISGGVTKQIGELAKGAQRIAHGDLDYQVKVKGADEIARLARLFNQMSVDLKQYIEKLQRTTTEKERLLKELEIARGIQQSFLPDAFPKIEGIQISAMNLPARIVGGDFYDFIPIAKDVWGLVIADVSGKGVPAALFMALSRALMRASASVALSPSETLAHANDLILQDSKSSMFVTLFYAVLDAPSRVLKYSNAGHNPALFVSGPVSNIVFLKAQAMPLGITSQIEAKTEEIALKKGDLIVLYTDGVTEAINERQEQYQIERLQKVVKENCHLSSAQLMQRIENDLQAFVGKQSQFDDITMMIIKAT